MGPCESDGLNVRAPQTEGDLRPDDLAETGELPVGRLEMNPISNRMSIRFFSDLS